jgi:hypothetical protein
MSLMSRLSAVFSRTSTERHRTEDDVPVDQAQAGSRVTGGGPDVGTMDKNSTTGGTESGEFVGRAGSDETGDVGVSGAEARGDRADGATGAARPE